jgi:hypothetical protein
MNCLPQSIKPRWVSSYKNLENFRFELHPNREALAPSETCGTAKTNVFTRIVGGQEAELGAYPWLANLGFQVNHCTCVLIVLYTTNSDLNFG